MKRVSLEQRAIAACYSALYELSADDPSLTWVDRQELVEELRAVVRADKARDRRRAKKLKSTQANETASQ